MNVISQIFPKTGRISGPEVGDGAKPDVPTTDRQNEKKKKHRPFYEAVDAHAHRRLTKLQFETSKASQYPVSVSMTEKPNKGDLKS